MSRDLSVAAGFVLLHLALVAVGASLLYLVGAIGADRRRGALVWALGPAYLVGVAVLMTLGSALLAVGISVDLWVLAPLAVVFVGAMLATHRADLVERVSLPRLQTGGRYERTVLIVVAVGAAFYVVWTALGLMNARIGWDASHFWSLRGVALYHFGELEPRIFENGAFESFHLAYPVGQPLLEATTYHSWGGVDVRLWHIELWFVWVSAIWSIAYLVSARTGHVLPAVVMPVLALLMPAVIAPVELGYADVTAASFFGVGVLCLGLCLSDGRRGWALLAGLLLAASANVKNEGFAYSAVALVLVAVALVARYGFRRGGGTFLWTAVPFVALIAPWRIWLRVNGPFGGDQRPILDSLDWGFLTERWERVEISVRVILENFISAEWMMLVPLFLALGILCMAAGHRRSLTGYYLAVIVLTFASLVWVYWTGYPPDVSLNLRGTAWRVPLGIALAAAAASAHLISELYAHRMGPSPPDPALPDVDARPEPQPDAQPDPA